MKYQKKHILRYLGLKISSCLFSSGYKLDHREYEKWQYQRVRSLGLDAECVDLMMR